MSIYLAPYIDSIGPVLSIFKTITKQSIYNWLAIFMISESNCSTFYNLVAIKQYYLRGKNIGLWRYKIFFLIILQNAEIKSWLGFWQLSSKLWVGFSLDNPVEDNEPKMRCLSIDLNVSLRLLFYLMWVG